MTKLCPECEKKPADRSVAGRCGTPHALVPSGHQPYTDSPSFTMCEACCEQFSRCARCNGPLEGGGGVVVPTDKQFVLVTEDGRHVKGMFIGEQILIQKYVDVYSGMTWQVSSLTRGVRLYGRRETQVPGNWRYQKLELYFDLVAADEKATIQLVEVASNRWATGSGSTFSCTAEVKH